MQMLYLSVDSKRDEKPRGIWIPNQLMLIHPFNEESQGAREGKKRINDSLLRIVT